MSRRRRFKAEAGTKTEPLVEPQCSCSPARSYAQKNREGLAKYGSQRLLGFAIGHLVVWWRLGAQWSSNGLRSDGRVRGFPTRCERAASWSCGAMSVVVVR